jgi:hypothetical protein
MGISLFSKDGYGDSYPPTITIGNPDPNNWTIMRTMEIGNFLILMIQYPDCKNYEGKKILVYEGVKLDELKKQKKIDPHFSDNRNFKSPVARFEPTDHGWNLAMFFCTAAKFAVFTAEAAVWVSGENS